MDELLEDEFQKSLERANILFQQEVEAAREKNKEQMELYIFAVNQLILYQFAGLDFRAVEDNLEFPNAFLDHLVN